MHRFRHRYVRIAGISIAVTYIFAGSIHAATASRGGAQASPLLQIAFHYLAHAPSYRSLETTGFTPGAYYHVIVVRKKGRWERYTITTDRAGKRTDADQILTAHRTCDRTIGAKVWTCSPGSNDDPFATDYLLIAPYKLAGDRTIEGQPCRGYRMTVTDRSMSPPITTTETIWINRHTAKPVRLNTYSFDKAGDKVAGQIVYSDWSDPTLQSLLPRVPGLTDGVTS